MYFNLPTRKQPLGIEFGEGHLTNPCPIREGSGILRRPQSDLNIVGQIRLHFPALSLSPRCSADIVISCSWFQHDVQPGNLNMPIKQFIALFSLPRILYVFAFSAKHKELVLCLPVDNRFVIIFITLQAYKVDMALTPVIHCVYG